MSVPYYSPNPNDSSYSKAAKPADHSANFVKQEGLVNQANQGINSGFSLESAENGSFKAKAGGGPTDVVNDFAWTYSKYREEVPRVLLVERQITANQQRAYMTSIPAAALASGDDPYMKLYEQAKPTGFSYIFPYITNAYTSVDQKWSEQCPPEGEGLVYGAANAGVQAAGKIGGLVLEAAGAATGNPAAAIAARGIGSGMSNMSIDSIIRTAIKTTGAAKDASFWGIDQPMYFSGGSKQTFSIKFPLFNTFSVEQTQKHIDFIRIFKYQNLYDRIALAAYNPPVIYESKFIDGYRTDIGFKPALFVSKFTVTNLGSVHAIDIGSGGKMPIPEAFMIDIQLSEMITTSRAIYSSSFTGGSIVNVY